MLELSVRHSRPVLDKDDSVHAAIKTRFGLEDDGRKTLHLRTLKGHAQAFVLCASNQL